MEYHNVGINSSKLCADHMINKLYFRYQDCYNLSAITTFPDQNSMMNEISKTRRKRESINSKPGKLYQLGTNGYNPFVDLYTQVNYASTDR